MPICLQCQTLRSRELFRQECFQKMLPPGVFFNKNIQKYYSLDSPHRLRNFNGHWGVPESIRTDIGQKSPDAHPGCSRFASNVRHLALGSFSDRKNMEKIFHRVSFLTKTFKLIFFRLPAPFGHLQAVITVSPKAPDPISAKNPDLDRHFRYIGPNLRIGLRYQCLELNHCRPPQ